MSADTAFAASSAHRCATALSQGFLIPAITKEWIMTEATSGILSGKVALVTGAGRGQGRAHALTLARNGADIIAVDIAAQVDTVAYPLSTPDGGRDGQGDRGARPAGDRRAGRRALAGAVRRGGEPRPGRVRPDRHSDRQRRDLVAQAVLGAHRSRLVPRDEPSVDDASGSADVGGFAGGEEGHRGGPFPGAGQTARRGPARQSRRRSRRRPRPSPASCCSPDVPG